MLKIHRVVYRTLRRSFLDFLPLGYVRNVVFPDHQHPFLGSRAVVVQDSEFERCRPHPELYPPLEGHCGHIGSFILGVVEFRNLNNAIWGLLDDFKKENRPNISRENGPTIVPLPILNLYCFLSPLTYTWQSPEQRWIAETSTWWCLYGSLRVGCRSPVGGFFNY